MNDRENSLGYIGEEVGHEDGVSLGLDDGEAHSHTGRSQSENSDNLNLKRETNRISVIRCLVITTLLTLAAIVSNVTYIIALNAEERNFEDEFERYSNRILSVFFRQWSVILWSADSLTWQLSPSKLSEASSGVESGNGESNNNNTNNWPLITIPDFELLSLGSRELALANTVMLSPVLRSDSEREEWEAYASSGEFSKDMSLYYSSTVSSEAFPLTYKDTEDWTVPEGIYCIHESTIREQPSGEQYYIPIWQTAPYVHTAPTIMFNQLSEKVRRNALEYMLDANTYVISDMFYQSTSDSIHQSSDEPMITLFYPIKDEQQDDLIVAVLGAQIPIGSLFYQSLEGSENPLIAVIESDCGAVVSYELSQDGVTFLGEGDLHENVRDVNDLVVNSSYVDFDMLWSEQFQDLNGASTSNPQPLCSYRLYVYPTAAFRFGYLTNKPIYLQAGIGCVFFFATMVFIVYDCLVERRQRRVLESAQRTNAIVSSLFPAPIRERLYQQAEGRSYTRKNSKKGLLVGQGVSTRNQWMQPKAQAASNLDTPKLRLKSFLNTNQSSLSSSQNVNNGLFGVTSAIEPIADLFPSATVLFADIAGFTAWSSEREPSQVFTLLETLYGGMDKLAKRLGVFKVETVGDCYVAATGLPDHREDHAIVMTRFANACMSRVRELTSALESTLGPGTADLGMRIGIHSGPVTAGVLRGEKSRFQLFGDTMNTASRMESTGFKGQIQLSRDTALLLEQAGKSHWIRPRDERVTAKGKGEMQTFWLQQESTGEEAKTRNSITLPVDRMMALHSSAKDSRKGSQSDLKVWGQASIQGAIDDNERIDRLVDWNVQILLGLLQKIVAVRYKKASSSKRDKRDSWITPSNGIVLEEIKEVVVLPEFDAEAATRTDMKVELSQEVRDELRDYVNQIAGTYRDNPFHNFEHASHVCLSAHKLLKRITRPDEVDYGEGFVSVLQDLHNHTYGISSDPVAQFAIVFSALIHDAGHTGVPNGQLAKEFPEIAAKYRFQSIAEQRSVDIAWELLSAPCYNNLRACMFGSEEERTRFRQLIVNSVLATDIFDRELGNLRKARWLRAFGSTHKSQSGQTQDASRRATIVIEHVIQASDVAHTMQHWHVYQKWNELLFQEMYAAYLSGRSDRDPSEGWYKGELWFFDNYVIPLAKKLRECGVFGVSSDEYLNYALENRQEWETKGVSIVERMQATMKQRHMREREREQDTMEEEKKDASVVSESAPVYSKSSVCETERDSSLSST